MTNSTAKNGDIEVIKWLHANQIEGCTINAMDRAVYYGHLNVVKFLYAERTTLAMDYP